MNSTITAEIVGTSFSIFSGEDVRKLSVLKITTPNTFDILGQPERGGFYDSALGPVDYDAACSTCGLDSFECPGHMGHIDLAVPLYNPLFFPMMMRVLKTTCLVCGHFTHHPSIKQFFEKKFQ